MENVFKTCPDITYCYAEGHKHGDLVVARGLPAAESVACEANATSDAHQMCAVMLPCTKRPPSGAVWPVGASASAPKAAATSASAAKPVETSATAAQTAESQPAVAAETSADSQSGAVWPVEASASAAKPAETSASAAKPVETSATAAQTAESQPAVAAETSDDSRSADFGESEHEPEALTDDSEHEPEAGGSAEKPAAPPCPMADAMCKALGEQIDEGEAERALLGQLEQQLGAGNWNDPKSGGNMKSPLFAKLRLERLLSKTTDIRRKYQTRLAGEGKIHDKDFNRSLSAAETQLIHNAWMNGVSSWMHAACLDQYMELRSQESTKGTGKRKAGNPASSAAQMQCWKAC